MQVPYVTRPEGGNIITYDTMPCYMPCYMCNERVPDGRVLSADGHFLYQQGAVFNNQMKLHVLTSAAHQPGPVWCALQRFRFSTSLVYACAVGLEFLTPLAPRYFLLLASIANVGKSVGLATHISTQPSFVKNFARQDNLADLTAKAQASHLTAAHPPPPSPNLPVMPCAPHLHACLMLLQELWDGWCVCAVTSVSKLPEGYKA